MNNNGWGLNEFILMLSIIGIAFITAVYFSNQFKNNTVKNNSVVSTNIKNEISNDSYIELEQKMINAAMNYNTKEKTNNIKLNILIDKSYIKEIADPENGAECSGYINFNEETNNYKAYLSCPANYQTIGYDKNYE